MSILSKEPDGCGFYYGFFESDPRQINIIQNKYFAERRIASWRASVSDDLVGWYDTKDEAEAAAIAYLKKRSRALTNQ